MRTITNCFLYIAILVVLCFLDILCLGINICERQWWLVALDAVAVVICVWAIRVNYKRAKRYEDVIRSALTDLYMRQTIRDFKEFLESRKPEAENAPEKKQRR